MDPLLDCLLILTQINERPASAQTLTAGLPLVKNKLTPQLFIRAAQRAGYSSRIVQRQLQKISRLVLPAILLLKDNQACIVTKMDKKEQTAEVIFPESGGGSETIFLDDLSENYVGFAIFLKPIYKFEGRADEFNIVSKESWFWGTLWHYRGLYSNVLIAALLINLFALAMPLFILNVYDRVVPNFAVETLWVLAIGIMIVLGFDFLLKTLRAYMIDVAGKKADTILAGTLFQQALNIKMAAKPASSGAFANNLREFEVLRDFFTSASVATLVDLPFILIFVVVIFIIGGYIGWIPLIAIPIIFCGAYFLEIPIRKAIEQSVFGATQKHAILVEAINRIEIIKSLSAESTIQHKWEQYVGKAAQSALKSRFFSTLAINFTSYTLQMVTVLTVILGVYLIASNQITMGGLIACVILSGRALAPLAQLASLITRFNQSKIALANLNKIMALPTDRSSKEKYLQCPNFSKNIVFHEMSFNYPNQEVPALSNINLKIKFGEKVAILGAMGSGKSTLEKMLLKLYEPTEGAIFIDGIDISQIDPAELRQRIGYVSQDYSLLYGTIYDNITLRMPWANQQLVLQSAKLAGVNEFVCQHPAGFAMPIGEQGHGISNGQRQSIAIARAIVSNPNLLLLDEPTSSIDNETEQVIINNLRKFVAQKTLIVITHKTTMLSLVDRIIILDLGKIIADGPKDKILKALQNKEIHRTVRCRPKRTDQYQSTQNPESKQEGSSNE